LRIFIHTLYTKYLKWIKTSISNCPNCCHNKTNYRYQNFLFFIEFTIYQWITDRDESFTCKNTTTPPTLLISSPPTERGCCDRTEVEFASCRPAPQEFSAQAFAETHEAASGQMSFVRRSKTTRTVSKPDTITCESVFFSDFWHFIAPAQCCFLFCGELLAVVCALCCNYAGWCCRYLFSRRISFRFSKNCSLASVYM